MPVVHVEGYGDVDEGTDYGGEYGLGEGVVPKKGSPLLAGKRPQLGGGVLAPGHFRRSPCETCWLEYHSGRYCAPAACYCHHEECPSFASDRTTQRKPATRVRYVPVEDDAPDPDDEATAEEVAAARAALSVVADTTVPVTAESAPSAVTPAGGDDPWDVLQEAPETPVHAVHEFVEGQDTPTVPIPAEAVSAVAPEPVVEEPAYRPGPPPAEDPWNVTTPQPAPAPPSAPPAPDPEPAPTPEPAPAPAVVDPFGAPEGVSPTAAARDAALSRIRQMRQQRTGPSWDDTEG